MRGTLADGDEVRTTSMAPPTSNLTIYLGIIGLVIVIALVSLIILRKR